MKINLITPINRLSYGYVGIEILKSLLKLGHEASIFPIGPIELEEYDREFFLKGIDNAQKFNPKAPSVIVYHAFDLKKYKRFPGLNIGFPIFELDTFSSQEKDNINSMDALLVTSKWAKYTINLATDKSVDICNLGVDSQVFDIEKRNSYYSDYDCNVLKFINIGKWEIRKGHDIIVECFHKVFGKDNKNICLTMVSNNPFLNEQENNNWARLYQDRLGTSVRIINKRFDSQLDIATQISQNDIGVFPARAEGWNMPLHQCLVMGLHCITTNYSAHTEFCNSNNSLLINPTQSEPAYDGEFFFGQGSWMRFGKEQIDQFCEYLNNIYKNPGNYLTIQQKEAKLLADRFTWENSAQQIINVINEI